MNHLGHLAGPSHDAGETDPEKRSTILGGLIKDDMELQKTEQQERIAQKSAELGFEFIP